MTTEIAVTASLRVDDLVCHRRAQRVVHRVARILPQSVDTHCGKSYPPQYLLFAGRGRDAVDVPRGRRAVFLHGRGWCRAGCDPLAAGAIVPELWSALDDAAWYGRWRATRHGSLVLHMGVVNLHVDPPDDARDPSEPRGWRAAVWYRGHRPTSDDDDRMYDDDLVRLKARALRRARLLLEASMDVLARAEVGLDAEMDGET